MLAAHVAVLALAAAVPGSAWAADNVAGNLITFDNDGMWSWYMDERAIVDPVSGKLLIGANSSSPVRYPTGRPAGSVDLFTYDLATGGRSRFQLSSIQEDDHNAPGLMILPNGKYLAMYSNHGNTSMGDYLSRYRVSNNPHDSSSWTAEQSFNWQTVPGWNTAPNANNRVSYHNLFYLSAEDKIYDFSRGTHQSANSLIFNEDTNTATWGGQLTTSAVGGYSTGYIKYASNGVDRTYFVSTETHPRNYNNNMWSGYVSGGKTYDMLGNVVDANIFDNEDTAGVGAVSDISSFTQIQAADPLGAGYNRLWSVDAALDGNNNPVAMYISRYDTDGSDPGNQQNSDHRLHYARWDGGQWHSYDIARLGGNLYTPEEDYTGLGALTPGDPNIVYVSTQYDPRDATGATVSPFREIYKGVTANGGENWTWSAITSGSTVQNLRPIVPAWDADHRAVIWFRGTYTSAQNTDAAVVGIIEQNDTQTGLVHYVDATTGNTTRSDGTPLGATGPSASAGATDGNWHIRSGFGNGGNVLTADEAGSEAAPAIKTTLAGLADGTYDIFAFVWQSPANDWQIQAGFSTSAMQLIRDNGAQQAETAQFDGAGSVTIAGDLVAGGGDDVFLYRYYVGRKTVAGGAGFDVFVDDGNSTSAAGANRAWYDGLGYALVTPVVTYDVADFNKDGAVDGADLAIWSGSLDLDAGGDANGDGVTDGSDLLVWQRHMNLATAPPEGGQAAVPEPTGALLAAAALAGLMFLSRPSLGDSKGAHCAAPWRTSTRPSSISPESPVAERRTCLDPAGGIVASSFVAAKYW